ncbi:MAG: hypothetical protein JSR21_04210 [Proteobacteria bacterium]|nr:hypothetical protein [Pseudomonadota bacterium]
MTTKYIWTLLGGQTQAGNALNNTQTDQFTVYGADNSIISIGGNLIVNGGYLAPYGQDTGTSITLQTNGVPGLTPPALTSVTDTITLDGGGNSLVSNDPLTTSTVSMTVYGSAGGNMVDLTNNGGTTTLNLGGAGNSVTLNGNASNSVTSTGGGAAVNIGYADDDLFGYSASVGLGGTGNTVTGGDENFTVSGGQGTVTVGDGTNNIAMTGTGNSVTVGGGNNTINAGGDGATVNILGVDSENSPSFNGGSDGPDDGPVPPSPTDNVTIAGANDVVNATYENVNIYGTAVTAAATITLGDGNNQIWLGGTGDNDVTVGNGANTINATGDNSIYNLGSGPNGVTLSGNYNDVNVTDPNGTGQDTVQLGAGAYNSVSFDHAGGSVTGTDTTGVTTVTQSAASGNTVNVNLNDGTGNISLGNGNDTITANGRFTRIIAGDGNDVVTANGNRDRIRLGNGDDTVTANGNHDRIRLGNGNDTVTANGNYDRILLGSGNDNLTALGSFDNIVVNSLSTSTDTISVGSYDTVRVTNGTDTITANGPNDVFYLNGQNAGTTVSLYGNQESVFLGSNASATINMNPASTGNTITVQALTSSTDYTGTIDITGFGSTDHIDLQGLGFASGTDAFNSLSYGPLGATLALNGGGSINFLSPVALNASEFVVTPNHGPV